MKPKQFNTNIIFRTTTTLRDRFKQYCKDNNTTISKELNTYMDTVLNNKTIEYKHYVGKGHPLYSYWVTDDQYNKFNELYNSNVNGCNEEQLKALCLEIQSNQ